MEIAITSRVEITGKDGRKWNVYEGVTKKGKTVKTMLNEVQQAQAPVIQSPTLEQVRQAFEVLPVVDFEFDERGRVESISEIQ